jgi:hypothetical protein
MGWDIIILGFLLFSFFCWTLLQFENRGEAGEEGKERQLTVGLVGMW